ncbi:hypothetical protein ACVKSY_001550 [Sphingomonas sp. PvP107]|jgi:hypothetical protein
MTASNVMLTIIGCIAALPILALAFVALRPVRSGRPID